MQILFISAATLVVLTGVAFAHDPGLSSADLTVSDESIDAVVTFNPRDLESLGKDADQIALHLLDVRAATEPLSLSAHTHGVDAANNVAFHLRFPRTQKSSPLLVASGVIDQLPFGHREFITVKTAAGATLGERLISAKENELSLEIAETAPPPSAFLARFAEFFLLGVRHILTGYDHLLFLAGILIVCAGFREAIRIITCFTIAHSITLALATFNLVSIPSRIVEPMIAASIVYVGIENLWRRGKLRWREVLTFSFGLVHGLGFASVLREMGIGSGGAGVAVPLLSFNLGVESGQLVVAGCFLPVAWKLKSTERFSRITVPALSCLIAAAGAYWFIERVAS